MSRPLFEVGEEVIVCSKSSPEFNGESVVLSVFIEYEEQLTWYQNQTGDPFTTLTDNGQIAYLVDADSERLFSQSALRKKHKPGESFDMLMQQLKKPVTA